MTRAISTSARTLARIRRGSAVAILLNGALFAFAAQAQPAGDTSSTAAKSSVPDLSGTWNKDRGRVGAVKNLSPYPDMVMGDYNDPILQPWAAAQVKEHYDLEKTGSGAPEAKMTCWPAATPNVIAHGNMQVLQTPDTVVILSGEDHQWRFVRLNQPHSAHPTPTWYGESVGHYEGDTLVVDTIGIAVKPMSFVDDFGTPHTDKLHVVERYHVVDSGKALKIDEIVDDPGTFTKKWSVTASYNRSKNPMSEDGSCSANNVLVGDFAPSIGKMPEAKYISPF